MKNKVQVFMFIVAAVCVPAPSAFPEVPTASTDSTSARSTEKGQKPLAKAIPKGLQKDLILYYSFEKDEGRKVTDLSGKGNHGQSHNSVKRVKEEATSWAMLFDGKGDHIHGPDVRLEKFTFSAWVNSSRGRCVNNRVIFFLSDGERHYGLEGSGANGSVVAVAGAFEPGPFGLRVPDESFKVDVWTHVAVTYDGRTFKLYWNGQQKATGDIQTDGVTGTLLIGGAHEQDKRVWHGMIDDVAVFGRALKREEMEGLFRANYYSADVERARDAAKAAEQAKWAKFYAHQVNRWDDYYKVNGRPDWIKDPEYYKKLDTAQLSVDIFSHGPAITMFENVIPVHVNPQTAFYVLKAKHYGFREWFEREDMWKGMLSANEYLSSKPAPVAGALTCLRYLYLLSPLREQLKGKERIFLASNLRVLKRFKSFMENHDAQGMFYGEPCWIAARVAMPLAKRIDPQRFAQVNPVIDSAGLPEGEQKIEHVLKFITVVIESLDGFVSEQDYRDLDKILK